MLMMKFKDIKYVKLSICGIMVMNEIVDLSHVYFVRLSLKFL